MKAPLAPLGPQDVIPRSETRPPRHGDDIHRGGTGDLIRNPAMRNSQYAPIPSHTAWQIGIHMLRERWNHVKSPKNIEPLSRLRSLSPRMKPSTVVCWMLRGEPLDPAVFKTSNFVDAAGSAVRIPACNTTWRNQPVGDQNDQIWPVGYGLIAGNCHRGMVWY